jgi:hypothetical protein
VAWPKGPADLLGHEMMRFKKGERTTWPPPGVAVNPGLFPSYAGTYDDPSDVGLIKVAENGSVLSIDIPTFDTANIPYNHALQPTSMDNFIVNEQGTPLPLTFIADSTGNYVWLRTRQAVAERVPSDARSTLYYR